MPKRNIDVTTGHAYSYELWMGHKQSIVHVISDASREKLSVILPKDRVEKIAREIDAGKQPFVVVSATVFETADEARKAIR